MKVDLTLMYLNVFVYHLYHYRANHLILALLANHISKILYFLPLINQFIVNFNSTYLLLIKNIKTLNYKNLYNNN